MAVLKLETFGGLKPKDSARALPNDAAQTATNLAPYTMEFRPLAQDDTVVAASGVTNPLGLYRLQRNSDGTYNTDFATAAKWQISLLPKSFVKAQINSDTSERTYLTIDDASAPPRVIDNAATDRLLGVPTPTTAPTIVVNVVDEFTTEDRGVAMAAALQDALDAVRTNVVEAWVGATHPGTTVTGYVDQLTTYGYPADNKLMQVRAYRLTGAGGTVSDAYSTVAASMFSWIFDPLLAGFQGQSNGTPTWAGVSGTYHYGIPFHAYGLTYTLNTGALSTALTAIAMPGLTDGTKLLTAGQVTEVITALNAHINPAGIALKPRIDALLTKVTEVKALLDGGAAASLAGAVSAFYGKTDVAAAITAAKQNFANSVWNQAWLVARSSVPADYIGAGAAGGDST